MEDTRQPLRISFDYKREKAGDWDNLRTIPQLARFSLVRLDPKDPPVESVAAGSAAGGDVDGGDEGSGGLGVEFPEAVHEHSAWVN